MSDDDLKDPFVEEPVEDEEVALDDDAVADITTDDDDDAPLWDEEK